MRIDCKYILKTIMKPTIKTILVYENFDTMFAKWVVENEFVSYDNLTNNFLQIIRWVRRVSFICLSF